MQQNNTHNTKLHPAYHIHAHPHPHPLHVQIYGCAHAHGYAVCDRCTNWNKNQINSQSDRTATSNEQTITILTGNAISPIQRLYSIDGDCMKPYVRWFEMWNPLASNQTESLLNLDKEILIFEQKIDSKRRSRQAIQNSQSIHNIYTNVMEKLCDITIQEVLYDIIPTRCV